jgi:hypothetical protein
MRAKKLVIVGAVALAVAGGITWKVTSAREVGVSKISGNPAAFVGKVKILGKTGGVDAARGLFQIVDEKGCCNLVVGAPLTKEQKDQIGADALYLGALPQTGQEIEAHGTLRQVEGGYQFDVVKVTSAGKVLLRKQG